MGMINFIKSFFEESEEEIKEEIKEAEKIKKEAEKRLEELKNKKKSKISKKQERNLTITITIILIIIIGFYGLKWYKSIPKPFKYECNELNPCTDCLVTASCIMFEETIDNDYIHFTIENKNILNGNCNAKITITNEDSILSDKIYKLGQLIPNQNKVFKIELDLPDGETQTSVEPMCEWE